MASESSIFKPSTSGSGLGTKKMDDGQFSNPPAYPDVSGFTGPSVIKGDGTVNKIQKSPTGKSGRV